MKQVIYNGGTHSYYSCSDPIVLRKGEIYAVLKEEDREWQTDYTLEGIEGEFNSTWFDPVLPTYFAIGNEIPTIGKQYECKKAFGVSGGHCIKKMRTGKVESIECVGLNTYKVTTMKNIYIVKIQ